MDGHEWVGLLVVLLALVAMSALAHLSPNAQPQHAASTGEAGCPGDEVTVASSGAAEPERGPALTR